MIKGSLGKKEIYGQELIQRAGRSPAYQLVPCSFLSLLSCSPQTTSTGTGTTVSWVLPHQLSTKENTLQACPQDARSIFSVKVSSSEQTLA